MNTIYYNGQGFLQEGINEIPAGAVQLKNGQAERLELLDKQAQGFIIQPDSKGYPRAVPPPGPTPEERAALFDGAVTAQLDEFARQKQYDSMSNARLTLLSDAFHADGVIAQKAYDDTWASALELMPAVTSGALSIEDACAQLPPLVWPDE